MKNNKLTKKQEEVLIYIKKYIAKNDFPPTVREVAKAVNLSSPATVHVHLTNLIQKGYIKRNKKNNRMLELLVPNEFETVVTDEVSIKLLQNNKRNSSYKVLKSSISKYDGVIAFKMDNDSMIDAGILKGDILIFETANKFNYNDIILFKQGEILIAKEYSEDIDNYLVLGKLVKLYREY